MWIVTGSVALAAIELVIHFIIDFAKCENWTGFSADQIFHVVCKIVFVALLYFGPAWVTWTPA